MTDVVDAKTRSRMMSGIRGRDTKPEMLVRRALFKAGFRFRLHRRDLPGVPDVVLPGRRLAIFVHGCFWHAHQGCRYAKTPASRREFWGAKLAANVERDKHVRDALLSAGWRVLVVWECLTRSTKVREALPELLARWIEGPYVSGELGFSSTSSMPTGWDSFLHMGIPPIRTDGVRAKIDDMDTRDALTKSCFNKKVTVDTEGRTFAINGLHLSPEDLAGLTGAPDGSHVVVREDANGILLRADNLSFFECPAEYTLTPVVDSGDTLLLDETLMLKTSEDVPEGIGLRIFATQAHTAARLGIAAIALQAAGSRKSRIFNGYYTWPRYGFDALLEEKDLQHIPKELGTPVSVADLMETESGRAWWRENGHENYMEFDLTHGSRSWQTLIAVMKEKGVKL